MCIWEWLYFSLPFEGHFCLTQDPRLTGFYFPFRAVETWAHCPLASGISDEKSGDQLSEDPLYDELLLLIFQHSTLAFWGLMLLSSRESLWVNLFFVLLTCVYSCLHQTFIVFNYCFFKHSLLTPSWVSCRAYVRPLHGVMQVPQVFLHFFSFLFLFLWFVYFYYLKFKFMNSLFCLLKLSLNPFSEFIVAASVFLAAELHFLFYLGFPSL